MHISIVLLVFVTLVLVMSALVFFHLNKNKLNLAVAGDSGLVKLYTKAETLNFYLRNICEKLDAAKDPVATFRKELDKYKNKDGSYAFIYLTLVDSQINGDHIMFSNDAITASFDISLVEVPPMPNTDYGGVDKAVYSYNFKCTKMAEKTENTP